jgi:DNA processing protein
VQPHRTSSPPAIELTPQALLDRPLNEVEQQHAPVRFFAAGDLGLVRSGTRVAIVGTRKASPEGLRRARKLAAMLARDGVIVVSGLAEGIDTAAHQATIAAGGKTVAVLGTSLDRAYPQKNLPLQRTIMAEHLALSPFAPGSRVSPGNFPFRNRVMALISDATVIIEASETSGALYQGWEAIRLGRLLFIPKSVAGASDLAWPRKMLRYGAQILTSAASVTSLLPVVPATGPAAVAF